MLPLRGASMDLLGTNMSDENLVQVMLMNKSFIIRTFKKVGPYSGQIGSVKLYLFFRKSVIIPPVI